MKRRLLWAMCGIVALAALACGSGGPAPTPVPTPTLVPIPPGGVVIETDIEGYVHGDFEIEVGTTIIWTNRDTGFHTVTHTPTEVGQEVEWVSSGNMAPGSSFRHTFENVGTFRYVCRIHASTEKGTVTVVAASGS